MEAFFELIDLGSGNVIADFADADDALAALQRTAAQHGRPAIRNLSLMRIDGDHQILVAMQDQLTALDDAFDDSPAAEGSVAL